MYNKKKWTPFKMRKSWPIIISCLWSSTIIFFSNLFVRQKNRNDDRQEIWVLVSENLGGFRSMGLYRLVYFEEFSIKSGGGSGKWLRHWEESWKGSKRSTMMPSWVDLLYFLFFLLFKNLLDLQIYNKSFLGEYKWWLCCLNNVKGTVMMVE